MLKKTLAILLTAMLALSLFGSALAETKVVLSLGNAADYYIGIMVGESVKAAFEEAGATVQVLDAGDDAVVQINQMQNAITAGCDIMYVFPARDGETYFDTLLMAKAAGIKTIASNNYPGEGGADAYVGQDEFQMGAMMAALVSDYVDKTYPDAEPGSVKVLILESTFNTSTIKRCLGMRLISEEFIRKADIASIYFGDIILDENGDPIPNPYYNNKIQLIEYANRMTAGTDAVEAQNAIENAVTMGASDLKLVISYGDVGAASETKLREMIEDGRISTPIEKIAVFCSDLTDTNKQLILASGNNSSILRGVMASGDLIATIQNYAKLFVEGKYNEVPAYTMQPLSYMMLDDEGSAIEAVYYTDLPQLPDTDLIF